MEDGYNERIRSDNSIAFNVSISLKSQYKGLTYQGMLLLILNFRLNYITFFLQHSFKLKQNKNIVLK